MAVFESYAHFTKSGDFLTFCLDSTIPTCRLLALQEHPPPALIHEVGTPSETKGKEKREEGRERREEKGEKEREEIREDRKKIKTR